MNYRMEADSIGTKQVPADAYYGVQSLRGYENFDGKLRSLGAEIKKGESEREIEKFTFAIS